LSHAEIPFPEKCRRHFRFDGEDFSRVAARAGVRLRTMKSGENRRQNSLTKRRMRINSGVRADMAGRGNQTRLPALIREHHPDRLMAQGFPGFVPRRTKK